MNGSDGHRGGYISSEDANQILTMIRSDFVIPRSSAERLGLLPGDGRPHVVVNQETARTDATRERVQDWICGVCLGWIILGILSLIFSPHAHGAERIPAQAQQYRRLIIAAARWEMGGLDAPVATLAAQVHQESKWDPSAVSPVGARGLAQFMPPTARWWGELRPDLGAAQPTNPAWALRAQAGYMRWLLDRVDGRDECHSWAFALSGYNGGLGWVQRDQVKAAILGLPRDEWWGSVERVNAGRSEAAWRENRGYPRRILLALEPLYVAAGWGRGVCR